MDGVFKKKKGYKESSRFLLFHLHPEPKMGNSKDFLLAFSPLKSAELWTNSALFCLHTAEAYVASFTSAAKGFERGRRELPNEKLMDWISPLFFAVKYRRKAKKMACSGGEKGGEKKERAQGVPGKKRVGGSGERRQTRRRRCSRFLPPYTSLPPSFRNGDNPFSAAF